jgi:DNA mismatch endonuclease, patch repair protein
MRSNKGRDTSIELRIRRALFAQGFRYRVNYRPLASLRRTADIVFTRDKVAVFVDGCFWHGCQQHYTSPKANSEFWATKVAANMRRDLDTSSRLMEVGWTVLRYWEHESTESVIASIISSLEKQSRRTELQDCAPIDARVTESITSSKYPGTASVPMRRARSSSRLNPSQDVSGANMHA